MNLSQLASLVLALYEKPINKVRFAKAIYFCHKELIRKQLMSSQDIAYLRLPLGPVPEGFLLLPSSLPYILVHHLPSEKLSYNTEGYSLSLDNIKDLLQERTAESQIIHQTLSFFDQYSTPGIVEASHDPSWQKHRNGDTYHISTSDLKNPFPFPPKFQIKIQIKRPASSTNSNELGLLQANLVRGMLQDIVQESTDLEYPDEPHPEKPTTKRKITLKFRKKDN